MGGFIYVGANLYIPAVPGFKRQRPWLTQAFLSPPRKLNTNTRQKPSSTRELITISVSITNLYVEEPGIVDQTWDPGRGFKLLWIKGTLWESDKDTDFLCTCLNIMCML